MGCEEVRMSHGIESFVTIAPPIWPGPELEVQPGDLSLFSPMGNGLGAPMILMPWDRPESLATRGAYYGMHAHTGHPFTGAPVTEPAGGVVYFDRYVEPDDLNALFRVMNVRVRNKDYAAFYGEPTSPEDRHNGQMRIVSGGALEFLYRTGKDAESMQLRQQSLSIGELLLRFVDQFKTESNEGKLDLAGWLGGDGDWAAEGLAFGFMVENEYHAIYRIWARAWLVTK
jgi:hypothetical protein